MNAFEVNPEAAIENHQKYVDGVMKRSIAAAKKSDKSFRRNNNDINKKQIKTYYDYLKNKK